MDYTVVSKELLTTSILQQFKCIQSEYVPSPQHTKTILEFSNTAFFDLYKKHWGEFIELRHQIYSILGNPNELTLNDNSVSFNINTHHITSEVLSLLHVYLQLVGWEDFSVEYIGKVTTITHDSFHSIPTYKFDLTAKSGTL